MGAVFRDSVWPDFISSQSKNLSKNSALVEGYGLLARTLKAEVEQGFSP
jgi:hypothetical protein